MTDDRIPFLKFKQYGVAVEYKTMTPKELAAEIMRRRFKFRELFHWKPLPKPPEEK